MGARVRGAGAHKRALSSDGDARMGQKTGMSKKRVSVKTNASSVAFIADSQNLNSGSFRVKPLNSASLDLDGNTGPSVSGFVFLTGAGRGGRGSEFVRGVSARGRLGRGSRAAAVRRSASCTHQRRDEPDEEIQEKNAQPVRDNEPAL